MTTTRFAGLGWAGLILFAGGCSSSPAYIPDASGTGGADAREAGAPGGGDAAADSGAALVCPPPPDFIDPFALIDDMEDGSAVIPNVMGRNGEWWAGGDMTPGGTISPNGDANPEPIPGGRCGSKLASHVTGQGFNDWGAILSVTFKYGSVDGGAPGAIPVDVSGYQGLTFWARIGDTSTNSVRLALSDQHARPEGGICVVGGPPGMACWDTFGTDIPQLDTAWHRYKIPFAGLSQRDFGVKADKLDTHFLYTIEFAFAPGAIFDFWVDDLSLY